MTLTRNFKKLARERVVADPAFGTALLREGIDTMLAGDVDTGKSILCDYIKATIGFERLGVETGTQPKSLIRMFGPRGNSQVRNLFGVLGHLQKRAARASCYTWPRSADDPDHRAAPWQDHGFAPRSRTHRNPRCRSVIRSV